MSVWSALFRDLKRNWLYASLLSIVLGIVLLAFPGIVMRTVCYLIAILFMLLGVKRIVAYFRGRGSLFFSGGLLLGLSALLIGILIFVRVESFVGILPFVIGIVTIFSGTASIQSALDLRREGYAGWIGSMIMSVLSVLIGMLLIINPFASLVVTVMFIGVSLIVDGFCDLITAWMFSKRLK